MYVTQAQDWKSEQMVRAEYGLDDAVERAYRDMRAADEVLAEVAANDERRAAEFAEMWREHAHRDGAPTAWKAVIEKVDAGELSWRDLASGAAIDHPAVRAAIAADARPVPARTRKATDEDTYFEEFTVLRKRRPRQG